MNKLFYPTILFLFFLVTNVFSQKEANIWYFGQNAGLDFNTSPPTPLSDGELDTDEGCSTFSDANGNLLFYSDGISVYNKNHDLMRYSNGTLANDLEGNPSSTQSGMIIPKPGSSTIYYLFTVGTNFTGVFNDEGNPGFNYYTIDMSLNDGLGEITEGPINLAIDPTTNLDLSDNWSEKVTAVKGEQCNTFWVLSFSTDTFYAYKVDENGVDIENVVTSTVNYTSTDKRGYLQVSPDGTKIAFADHNLSSTRTLLFPNGNLQLFDFNDETGVVDPTPETLISHNTNHAPYGISFSNQSNKLYVSNYDGQFSIIQFDLESTNIRDSYQLIKTKIGLRGSLQLAPDGKIYVSIPDKRYLDTIENPDDNAEDIIYTENAIFLDGKLTNQGLPPFIASLLLPIEINDTTNNQRINNTDIKYCIGQDIIIETEAITGSNITYEWTFIDEEDNTSSISQTPVLNLTNLSTTNNGTYNLVISLENECGNTVTFEGTFNIEVFEPPIIANEPNNINHCDDGINSFNFQELVTPQIIGLQNPDTFEVIYFLTEEDVLNNENPIEIPYTIASESSSENIYVRIHNIEAPESCFEITNFNLAIFKSSQLSQPLDYMVCDDNIDGFFSNFILSTKDEEILDALDASQFTISYHTTESGAETSNQIDLINKNIPYTNTTIDEQLIYVRIENIENPECFVSSKENSETFKPFSLIVNPLPTINTYTELSQCSVNLTSFVNLTLGEINIVDNYTNETFKYYPTQNDAINNTSEITDPNAYLITNEDTVWVRVISEYNCYLISELKITISITPLITYSETFSECDDEFDNDGNNSDKDGETNFDISPVIENVKDEFPNLLRDELTVLIFETSDDRDTSSNPIPTNNLTSYRNTAGQESLYIKVINNINNNCVGIGEFGLKVNPLPDFEIETPQLFCLDKDPLTLEVENIENATFLWTKEGDSSIMATDNFLTVTSTGEYFITITTACSRTRTINVVDTNIAVINEDAITVIEDSNNNSIMINESLLESGVYEYALFNQDETEILEDYQSEPLFENLTGGIYTLSIQDENSCGVVKIPISILEYPKFLTPNSDGENDIWAIKGVDTTFYTKGTIYIFNRYGKKIAQLSMENDGWDGISNGKQMPPTDYWFHAELIDLEGNIINRKGHFSLLRN